MCGLLLGPCKTRRENCCHNVTVDELAADVEAALADARWADALGLLDAAGTAARTPSMLELRARAAYGHGDLEAAIEAWEQQHHLLNAAGDRGGAARAAAMVAMFLLIDTGLMASVRAWSRRAARLAADRPDSEVRPLLAAIGAYERFMSGDLATARRCADEAVELGARHDNRAAEVIGLTARARLDILDGRVDEGLARLDEVGGLLVSGEVDPLTAGMMLCELICAAQGLARHDLAVEWTETMDRWRVGTAFGAIHGRCRVHRAEILRVSGPCDRAEDEALAACDELRPWLRREFGWPLAELGNIRLRRGDLSGAEEAFLAAHEHGWSAYPGLALLRLAQGDPGAAQRLIREAIERPVRTPSKERPPTGELTLAPLLDAQVEIAVAAGDLETAREAAARLRGIAQRYPGKWHDASAWLADARVALSAGELDRAIAAGTESASIWADIGAPYETGLARLIVAEAHTRAGRTDIAEIDGRAAAAAFERYGASARAPQASARPAGKTAGGQGAAAPVHAPTSSGTFLREGDLRKVQFAGGSATLRDLKGFRYLARLLAEPGREFHVLDLVAVEQGTLPIRSPTFVGDPDLGGTGVSNLPMIDEQARQAYRRRLAEVEADIEDARRCNDPARADLAERDRDFLIAELRAAVGLGGRLRSVGSDAERARSAVTRALHYATRRLSEQLPALGTHLHNGVHTGIYCSYRPDPLTPVAWTC